MKSTSKQLWSGKYLRTIEKEFYGPDGKYYYWECYERIGSHGVVIIVPVTDDHRLVLIRQYRPPVEDRVIELPAGLVDEGETPESTALRELLEETGYTAANLAPLVAGPYSPALSSGTLNVFLATGLRFDGHTVGDANEQIETLLVPLDEASDWLMSRIKSGEKVDLKVFGFIHLAQKALASD